LIYSAGPHGIIAGATTQTVLHGEDATTVTAIPDVGYHFVSWSDGVKTDSRQDLHVTTNIAVMAFFVINHYELTYYAGPGGTVDGGSSVTQMVDHGANGATVTASPDAGHHFVGWSDGVMSMSRQDTNVTTGLIVTADFEVNRYSLTYGADANGRLAGPTSQSVPYMGAGEAVTAIPDFGYHFIRWSDGATSNPRVDANVKADISTTASFALGDYSLIYIAGPGGTLDGVTSQAVPQGASGTSVTAVPNPGYHFLQWSDGVTSNPRTDENVMTDISVTALFLTHDALLEGIKRYLLGLGPAAVGYDRNRDGCIDAADLLYAIQEPR
ncbi:MAG: InlB B-repeat-containing protein, partial [Candidatus Sumerlaeota bacterium]|nr:InlB B-repeat-containing protein [Candidatus Sumerlaeota bacterium]